ncbi:tRNA lysidine(34) synthetase TilS [Cellulomonas sp. APG4]|uniref:tRNA lysidine(34) synthetase TilS n=1 Tax=Cellulomonas sp. APG4 TaxID=1538656 RepID=UPI00137B5C7F|nr:tRNA lysidine(34) synthetase TilS [Cellulomonas sp. APG4]NCT91896.1 tRNA lysidine(34) synthetase TilS [Cellulomonas sp. APG4]
MTGPAPVVARLRTAVRDALADLPDGALVLVACSGGADSLALAAATAFVAPRAGLRAGAVVVDHGLQRGSAAVADRAAQACRRLGLAPVEVHPVDVEQRGRGPEAAAREVRYAALETAARAHGAAAVLLGHTLDDQAETVLLGLARGAGPRALAGMAPVRGLLRRPLLGVRRDETLAACAAQGLEPWHDPTNADGPLAPLRSRLRHRVLPVLEDVLGPVAPALARTAEQLRDEDALLDSLAHELLTLARVSEPSVPDGGADAVVLDVQALAGAPAALRRRALHRAVLDAGARPGALLRTHVLAVEALVVAWHGQGPVALPGGGEARRTCGRLTLRGSPAARGERAERPRTHEET